MSTNKTENYQLHAWAAGDDFLRTEFNENFAAIDDLLAELPTNKKLKIVTGSYFGTGNNGHVISLGFRPKLVLVLPNYCIYAVYQLLLLPGLTSEGGQLTENGFQVGGRMNLTTANTNVQGDQLNPYRYVAVWWED